MRDADNGTSAVVRGTAEERPNGQIVVSNGTVIFVPRNGSFPRMMTVSGLDTLTIEPDGWVTFQRGI